MLNAPIVGPEPIPKHAWLDEVVPNLAEPRLVRPNLAPLLAEGVEAVELVEVSTHVPQAMGHC